MIFDKHIYISYYFKDDINSKEYIDNTRCIKIKYYDDDIYYVDENNDYHRTTGPAIIEHRMDYNKHPPEIIKTLIYYIHGKRHRLDGPAYIEHHKHQYKQNYYIDGEKINEKTYWDVINNRIEKGLI